MTFGLACDRDGYDLRIPQCERCGSRGCQRRDNCKPWPKEEIEPGRFVDVDPEICGRSPSEANSPAAPVIENPDIGPETGDQEVDSLIHRLLDAQQDISFAANAHMDQSLCDAAALIDDVERYLRKAAPVGDGIVWRRVNDDPFEYAIQQGPHGDEFVKLLDGSRLRCPVDAGVREDEIQFVLKITRIIEPFASGYTKEFKVAVEKAKRIAALASQPVVSGVQKETPLTKQELSGADRSESEAAFEVIEQNCWDLRCVDIPTGAGDADIGWQIVEHHMAPPKERVVGYGNSPLEALNDAMTQADAILSSLNDGGGR